MAALRVDGIGAEFGNRIIGQNRHQSASGKVVADRVGRALKYAGSANDGRPQCQGRGCEPRRDLYVHRVATWRDEAPFVLAPEKAGVLKAIMMRQFGRMLRNSASRKIGGRGTGGKSDRRQPSSGQ